MAKTGEMSLEEKLELRKLRKTQPELTAIEVAKLLHRSPDTIRRLAKAMGYAFDGKPSIPLGTARGPYSEDRIQRVRDGARAARERRGQA